eukprot:2823088-Amphidinium_carterae.1
MDMKDPDYDNAVKTVEDYYRNVCIDNEQGDLNAFKGKYKGKGKYSKGEGKQDDNYRGYSSGS